MTGLFHSWVSAPAIKIFLLIALFCDPAKATSSTVPEELSEGVVRFALATGDITAALPLQDRLKGDSADYLRGRLLLESGNVQQGLDTLVQVAQGRHHRGEAALMVARHYGAEGDADESRNWYQVAAKNGFGETRQKARFALAELQRHAGRLDAAGKTLAGMDEGYWTAVGYLNLATDFARTDLNPSRALVSLRVALAMCETDTNRERSKELKSRLLVRAGQLAYAHEDYDKAIGFLKKVSLDSYRTPQALYLHGLALSEQGNYRAAMQSWHRAKKYPLAYPGVEDAWLGMGRGYDLAGYLGQAGEAFLAASAAYEGERATLRELEKRIREAGAYKALVDDARNADLEWFLADSRTLTQPRLAYLLGLIENPVTQRAVARVAELEEMIANLEQQERDLTVFMAALRNKPSSDTQGRSKQLSADQDALTNAVAALSGSNISPAQKRHIRALRDALNASGSVLERLSNVGGGNNQRQPRKRQAERLRKQTQSLLVEVRAVRDEAGKALDRLALEFIEQEDQRMAFALDKTEQQIAHLYEYLALKKLDGGKP